MKLMNPKILGCSSMSEIEDGDIPEWLLVEVLIRLPVKYVFRFKLVSKQWLSIISNPYFARAYVSRASLFSQPWSVVSLLMVDKDSKSSQVLEYGLLEDLYLKPSLSVVAVPSNNHPRKKPYLVLGVSNGLVLYGNRSYYICNPFTGHCVALPRLTCKLTIRGWGFLTCVENDVLKSYRVVRIEPPNQGSNSIRFQVYVSDIGEWKDFVVPCKLLPFFITKAATALNGILHWIAERSCIIAYDPYLNPKHMRIIKLPCDVEVLERQTAFHSLSVAYEGKLRYFEAANKVISGNASMSFRVWVLNDYSSGDWCLQHNISHEDIQYGANFPCPRLRIKPICYHPFDSDIVYLGGVGVCASYNIKTRKLQVEDEFFRPTENVFDKRHLIWWIQSFLFVIPHWPISMEG